MRLLVITQRVDKNDSNLGFFHRWLEKLSQKSDGVDVICSFRGESDLPGNVRVYSMGKEERTAKPMQFLRLQFYLIRLLGKTDGVFIHMAPIFAIASFPLSKILGKRILMWYVHRSINWKLKLAEKCVDKIYTASKESFSISSNKVEITGHGIDVDHFLPKRKAYDNKFRILFAGRISPIKDLKTLISALHILVGERSIKNLSTEFVGAPVDDIEKKYFEDLNSFIDEKGVKEYISFRGGVSYRDMPAKYNSSDVLVNLSPKGGMDKAVLEAMASELPVIVANETFNPILSGAGYEYIFKFGDPYDLSRKLESLMSVSPEKRAVIGSNLRNIIVQKHNLDNLASRIIEYFT